MWRPTSWERNRKWTALPEKRPAQFPLCGLFLGRRERGTGCPLSAGKHVRWEHPISRPIAGKRPGSRARTTDQGGHGVVRVPTLRAESDWLISSASIPRASSCGGNQTPRLVLSPDAPFLARRYSLAFRSKALRQSKWVNMRFVAFALGCGEEAGC